MAAALGRVTDICCKPANQGGNGRVEQRVAQHEEQAAAAVLAAGAIPRELALLVHVGEDHVAVRCVSRDSNLCVIGIGLRAAGEAECLALPSSCLGNSHRAGLTE